jgi:alcohol oxidase
VDKTNGHRSDAPHFYIYNRPEFKNLKILTNRRVVRVLFEFVPLLIFPSGKKPGADYNKCRGNKAVGVEHIDDVHGHPEKKIVDLAVAKAARLVVLAGGAFGSPAILERYVILLMDYFQGTSSINSSGIGSAELLKKLAVKCLVDLPGVGEHYMGALIHVVSVVLSLMKVLSFLDHNLQFVPAFASEDADTLDLLFRGTDEDILRESTQSLCCRLS